MSKIPTPLLIVWNILLTAGLAWALWPSASTAEGAGASAENDTADTALVITPTFTADSLKNAVARIAYFHMDSVKERYELIKEKDDSFKREGKRLESNLQSELAKAQARYEELMKKDHTYSTQTELKQDEAELQGLMGRIQQLQASGEDRLMRLEAEMLNEITGEIQAFLEDYNKQAGFDYIYSIQNGGQIWVGDNALNITADMVSGLNARYRASKKTAK
ncbi:MAG: OmpH family outer membrane protein [Flavobacteriales bacterium]|jgi:outer membrane protein|nr:OmpH family outer membrane protein [Flavobacteriales bacterium]